jgi:hypothetical protein
MQIRCTLMLGALLGASMMTNAATENAATEQNASPAQPSPVQASGLRVFIDPETGQLVSQPITEAQKKAVEAVDPSFRQDDEGLQIVYFADGSSMMDLQGRFQQATVAEAQPDGSLRTYCDDADHLKHGNHTHDPDATPVTVNPTREER